MKKTMRRIAETMAKVFMECMTIVFAFTCGCLMMDILYEWTSWSIGQGEDSIYGGLFFVLGYVVLRYQTRERVNAYLEKVNPKIEQIVGAVNRIEKANKDEAA